MAIIHVNPWNCRKTRSYTDPRVAAIAKNGIDLSALAAGAQMWGIPRKLYPEIWAQDVAVAGLVVLVLGLLVSLYPAFKAAGFTPTQAMRKY